MIIMKNMATNPQMFRNILPLFSSAPSCCFGGWESDVNIMEARNFVTAREMVQNNEYLLTTLMGNLVTKNHLFQAG